jgi:WD40 repeat protein
MARIFISYSNKDPEPAARIRTWLEANGFEKPFIDVSIPPGKDWERELYRQLERALAVLLVVTPNWLDSKWCFAEYTQARALGKPIFPIIETPVDGSYVAPEIQHLDLMRDREGGLQRLLAELDRIRLVAQGGFSFPPGRSPFPGLKSFDADDAAIYFGRDEECRRLCELLRARQTQGGSRLVVVLGASGSGKSSLMRAGVLPRLAIEQDQWVQVGPIRPLTRPVEQFVLALIGAFDRYAPGDETRTFDAVRGLLEADAAAAIDTLVRDLRRCAKRPNAFVLFAIDQGEELYSAAGDGERGLFLRVLGHLAAGLVPAVALMTFRSDSLGRLQAAPELGGDFHDFKVNPLPAARIPEIIRGPAAAVGLKVDDALVSQAAHDAGDAAALPLLAFALRELYERHGATGRLTLDDYRSLGDSSLGLDPLRNAVRQAADAIIRKDRLSPAELRALRAAFIPALVRVNTEGDYVRRRADWADLPAAAPALLERLVEARLLTADEQADQRTVEVSHEALLRDWPLLRGWLDEEREFLLGLEQLERDLNDWRGAPPQRRDQTLLTGLKLSRARAWLKDRPASFTDEQRAFMRDSMEAADRAKRRRTWGLTGVAVLLAIAAGFSTLQWQIARSQRDQANAALLAKRSADEIGSGHIYAAVELARQATSTFPTGETRSALLQALLDVPPELRRRALLPQAPARVAPPATPTRLVLATVSGGLLAVDTRTLESAPIKTPDGDRNPDVRALNEAADGTVGIVLQTGLARLIPPVGGTPSAIKLGDWVESADILAESGLIAFAAEGSEAAILRCDFTANPASAADCERQSGPAGHIAVIAIDPTGRTVAFGSEDGQVRIDTVGTVRETFSLQVPGRVLSLAWDPAGRWLAVSTVADGGRGLVVALEPGTRTVLAPTQLPSGAKALAWNRDGSALATSGDGGVGVCLWSKGAEGLVPAGRLYGHRESVQALAWGLGELTSLGLDNEMLVWEQQPRSQVFGSLDAPVPGVAFTGVDAARDRPRLAVGTDRGEVLVFDLNSRRVEQRLQTGRPDPITAVTWADGVQRLSAADETGRISVWDGVQESPVRIAEVSNQPINRVRWKKGGEQVFAPLYDGRVASLAPLTGLIRYSKGHHNEAALGLAIAPDGSLISSDAIGQLIRWAPETLEQNDPFPDPSQVNRDRISRDGLSFTQDGRHLAVVGNDGKVLIYNLGTRRVTCFFETNADQLQDVAYSGDDALIAALTNKSKVHVWSVRSGEAFATINLKDIAKGNPWFWPQQPLSWEARNIIWLADHRTLAVSTSAGKALLINFDDARWETEIGFLFGRKP